MDIAVVGLGKLGMPLAAVLASRGHRVIGIDINPANVNAVNAGRAPIAEPDLQHHIGLARSRLRAVTDFSEAIHGADISFVIVPTPSVDGVFSNHYVIDAVRRIGQSLRSTDRYHVVNITSTVMPQSTGGPIRLALEEASGRTVGQDVGLTYNPEFIALGSVVRDLLSPDMLLIGESDPRAGDMLEDVYREALETLPPVHRMNWVSAEIAKIAVNTYVTTKISYANMLAEICEQLSGADVDVVTAALGCDTRIGRKYLKGALGYGGPCFPRDNIAFANMARSLGVSADIAVATDAVNRRQVDRVVRLVQELGSPHCSVAVLGLAYKPRTSVIDESQGLMIARRLAEVGHSVLAFDPLALEGAAVVLGDAVQLVASADTAVSMADIVVVAAPAEEYAVISPEVLASGSSRRVILDCWRVLPRELSEYADIIYLGVGPDRGNDVAPSELPGSSIANYGSN